MGKAISRDSLKENYDLLAIAVPFLGLRVSVPTCQVHVQELYSWMSISCPSHLSNVNGLKFDIEIAAASRLFQLYIIPCYFASSGNTMDTQGWILRRMLSQINRICGRPHKPRDPLIRKLCALAGATWPERSQENETDESDGADDTSCDEESQSEAPPVQCSKGTLSSTSSCTFQPFDLYRNVFVSLSQINCWFAVACWQAPKVMKRFQLVLLVRSWWQQSLPWPLHRPLHRLRRPTQKLWCHQPRSCTLHFREARRLKYGGIEIYLSQCQVNPKLLLRRHQLRRPDDD